VISSSTVVEGSLSGAAFFALASRSFGSSKAATATLFFFSTSPAGAAVALALLGLALRDLVFEALALVDELDLVVRSDFLVPTSVLSVFMSPANGDGLAKQKSSAPNAFDH